MCCFFVPAAEAAVLVVSAFAFGKSGSSLARKVSFHCRRLSALLFGGSLLLAIEHLWHGELIFSPPFITAMKSPEDTEVMLHEIATTGVAMAVLVTVAYVLFAVTERITVPVLEQKISSGENV